MNARTTRRLTFQPIPGAASNTRGASIPAGSPVTVGRHAEGVWRLTASVDGHEDYHLNTSDPEDFYILSDEAAKTQEPADDFVIPHPPASFTYSAEMEYWLGPTGYTHDDVLGAWSSWGVTSGGVLVWFDVPDIPYSLELARAFHTALGSLLDEVEEAGA